MTDVQFHQDAAPADTAPNFVPTVETTRRFRLVPAAVICAILVAGSLIVYNYSQQKATTDEQVASRTVVDGDTTAGKGDAALKNTTTTTGDTNDRQLAVSERTRAAQAEQAAADVETEAATPVVSTTTKGGQVQAAGATTQTVVQQPVTQTVTYVPATNYVQPNTIYYVNGVPMVAINGDWNNWNNGYTYNYSYPEYKPSTPYIESCGRFDGGNRWNDVRIVLPKFEKDGKAAQEYHVQIGTDNGRNDVYDHTYQQTDRVVFSYNLDDYRTYYVRYQIRMNDGDWRDWSDTFYFRCHRN